MSEKRSLKRRGEEAAAAHLERAGVCVVEQPDSSKSVCPS